MPRVFLSFKFTVMGEETQDSRIGRELYDALVGRGLDVFFAPVSLGQSGRSDYAREIDKALDEVDTLVVIGTCRAHMDSDWVRNEWQGFANDILSGVKPDGRIFTLTHGMSPHDLPRTLRQYQNYDLHQIGPLVDTIVGLRKSSDAPLAPEPLGGKPSIFSSFDRAPSSADLADLVRAFPTRSAASSHLRMNELIDDAESVKMSGLSLNYLCQQLPVPDLTRILESGTTIWALFLDPKSEAMAAREAEEDYPSGVLASLTTLNIQHLVRVRDRLSPGAQSRLNIRLSSAVIRFNITLLADQLCICQPYLPLVRGVDSPTLVFLKKGDPGLYLTFAECFRALWEKGVEQ